MKKKIHFSRIVVAIVSFIAIFPFLWMILLSFKTDTQIMNSPFSLPEVWNFDNYRRALNVLKLPTMYKNTIILVFTTQIIGLTITFLSSYCLARMEFKSEKLQKNLYVFLLIGLIIPSYLLLFPLYRIIVALKIQNTYLSLIMPLTGMAISFNTLIFVGFLRGFPSEIEEAAIMDGCGLFNLCTRVVLPIMKPAFATLIVFNVIYVWNEYPLSATLINDSRKMTISIGASLFKGFYGTDYSGMISAAVLIIVPQLIFYVLLQKNIIEGMTAGAVKG